MLPITVDFVKNKQKKTLLVATRLVLNATDTLLT